MNTGPWHEQAVTLIRQAVLAPSSHNTQPWRFRISTSTIDLYADRTRALPVNDPADRELTISCGCALFNLCVGAAGIGLLAQVQLLPAPHEPDWLARVAFTGGPEDAGVDASLARFIPQRRTYRKRFAPREVDAAVLAELVDAARSESAWLLSLATSEARQQAASLVAVGDAAQWADVNWRRELAGWMHPLRRGDGLTVSALMGPVVRAVVRAFDMGGSVGAKDSDLAEASPLLLVLGTEHDDLATWLAAGQALQRVLLTACKHGLQASYLNQPVQVAPLRSKLRNLIGVGFPQIFLRIGYPASEIAPAPRREVAAVIDTAV